MRQLILPEGQRSSYQIPNGTKKFASLVENTHDKTVDFFQHED
jgi:hypothetical protein